MRTWGPPGGRYATTRPAAQGRMGARWSAAHATRPAQDRFWDTQWLHLVPHGCNWSHMAAPGPARLAVHRQRRAHAEVRLTQTSTATLKPAQHCGSPGPGRKFWKGSSALMRHSIAWPLNWMSSWLHVREQGRGNRCGDVSSKRRPRQQRRRHQRRRNPQQPACGKRHPWSAAACPCATGQHASSIAAGRRVLT